LYSTGGFVDATLYDQYNSVIRQSAFVLRGLRRASSSAPRSTY